MNSRIVSIHKPLGITSHDVVNRVRRITGVKKVGHAGTLDPMAEGVLVVAIGRESTKRIDSIVATEKEYVAEVVLGAVSATDDREGEITSSAQSNEPTIAEIKKCIDAQIGQIDQVPPVFSAIKVRGRPAHRRVRSGERVVLPARTVFIKEIDVLAYEYPTLKLRVRCGKGVYIRSLARDIGSCLGVGGYLGSLVRTRVGEYCISEALAFDELIERLRE